MVMDYVKKPSESPRTRRQECREDLTEDRLLFVLGHNERVDEGRFSMCEQQAPQKFRNCLPNISFDVQPVLRPSHTKPFRCRRALSRSDLLEKHLHCRGGLSTFMVYCKRVCEVCKLLDMQRTSHEVRTQQDEWRLAKAKERPCGNKIR